MELEALDALSDSTSIETKIRTLLKYTGKERFVEEFSARYVSQIIALDMVRKIIDAGLFLELRGLTMMNNSTSIKQGATDSDPEMFYSMNNLPYHEADIVTKIGDGVEKIHLITGVAPCIVTVPSRIPCFTKNEKKYAGEVSLNHSYQIPIPVLRALREYLPK